VSDPRPVLALAMGVVLLLVLPTVLGAAVDRAWQTAPLAMAVGTGIGVLLASAGLTRAVLRRYERIAPAAAREEETTE
jgi:hypothetical protein